MVYSTLKRENVMEENKAGKEVREYWVGDKQVVILSRPIKKSLTQNVAVKAKCERDEGSRNIKIWKKKIIGWANSMCKCAWRSVWLEWSKWRQEHEVSKVSRRKTVYIFYIFVNMLALTLSSMKDHWNFKALSALCFNEIPLAAVFSKFSGGARSELE